MTRLCLLLCALGLVGPPVRWDEQDAAASGQAARALVEALAAEGIELDLARGLCAVPARVLVRGELLEYVLVGPRGAAHESLLSTDVTPSLVNTALLTLGVERGRNATWTPREPPPTPEERRAGVGAYEVAPPEGDGFYLYVLWKERGEVYFFQVEDLINNLATGRRMERHRWVYLGSRFGRPEPDADEVFVADEEQNLVNLAFFSEGHTLLTAALPDCLDQTIWVPNAWLLPERDSPVRFVFARERLAAPPEAWLAALEDVRAVHASASAPGSEGGR